MLRLQDQFLGTCKHIEAALFKIRKNKRNAVTLKKEFQLPYTSIYLSYIGEQVVKIRIGIDQKKTFDQLAQEYFDNKNTLTDEGFRSIENFIKQAKKIN